MKQNSKISYLALILGVIVCLSIGLTAITPSGARYTTIAGWRMELKQAEPEAEARSDVLDTEGTAVLLSDMYVNEESRDVEVNMEAVEGTLTGALSCNVDNVYLTAQCLETAAEDTSTRFTVRLTPTEAALELTEKTLTTVKVVWDDQLWAVFQVTLLPVEAPVTAVFEEEAEQALPEAVNFLSCMTEFDKNEYLALQITVPEACDSLVLDLDGDEFPAFTRYSTDAGESFTLLYDRAWIELEPNGAHIMTLLIDFRQAELFSEELTVSAFAYYGDTWRGTATAATKAVEILPEFPKTDSPIVLNEEVALILGVPQNVGGAELNFYLRRLDGSVDQIPAIAVDAENGQVYIEAVGENHRAKAGTYLLDMNWTFQGVSAASRQIAFFVNYTSIKQEATAAGPETSEPEATEETGTEQVTEPTYSSDPTNATTIGGSAS